MGFIKNPFGSNITSTNQPIPNYDLEGKQEKDAEIIQSTSNNGSYVLETNSPTQDVGIFSAIFLILNRMIGTGIFATPSTIYLLSGSVGAALFMWVAGSLIAAAGLMVYLEWGSAIPKNGGEKNYLKYFYRKPKYLSVTMFSMYVFLLGWAASNSVVFGEYILAAAGKEVDRWNQRGIGLACVTFAFLINSINIKLGLWIQNLLGTFKLVLILIIVVTGWVALGGGLKGLSAAQSKSHFDNAFSGPHSPPSGYGVVMALYNVIWSFIGYSNANYALGEAKNPTRVLKISAPIALVSVSILYILVNIAYFAAVPKEEIESSGRILAASFFRIAFGESAQKGLSVCVALSALGNVMSVIFSQGRIVQELAKDGILPFSKFFASYKPFGTPMAGLFEHWVVSIIIILAPPPGDAYNFILNLISYPLSVVNCFVAFGLIVLTIQRKKYNWYPPIRATLPVTLFFFISSLYLVAAPYIPPDAGQNVYNDLPYWLHCVVGTCLFLVGGVYWFIRFKILPNFWPTKFSSFLESEEDEYVHINRGGIHTS